MSLATVLSILSLAFAAIVLVLCVLVLRRSGDVRRLRDQMAAIERGQERGEREYRDEAARNRDESSTQSRSLRQELNANVQRLGDSVIQQLTGLGGLQKQQLEGFAGRLDRLTEKNEERLDNLRAVVETKLSQIQTDNAGKLEEMRRTVDEKLSGTLDRRLGESFKLVSERLELVQKGLGEMQTLASGVGDLKKVLTNIKVRGTWGEVQLGNLLEQLLTPDQYEKNVVTKKGGTERVEYAIKLPGHDDQDSQGIWLPIDAKFPKEDYERLVDAAERADAAAVEEAGKQLENRIKLEAKSIRDKYIDPPYTTDFAILFLPTESLYAEILRKPGLHDLLQREYRVTVAGPTTLAAILNSFQMGFRTLAIQKRSGEVWSLLGAVKNEFRKFGEVIEKVETKIREAGNVIEKAKTRSRAIERKLKGVEELPAPAAQAILGPAEAADAEDEEGEAGDASGESGKS